MSNIKIHKGDKIFFHKKSTIKDGEFDVIGTGTLEEIQKEENNIDFCMYAKDDGMKDAGIHKGDTIFFSFQNTIKNGEIALVGMGTLEEIKKGESLIIARMYYVSDVATKTIYLKFENQNYAPMLLSGTEAENVKILGKAIAIQRNIK